MLRAIALFAGSGGDRMRMLSVPEAQAACRVIEALRAAA